MSQKFMKLVSDLRWVYDDCCHCGRRHSEEQDDDDDICIEYGFMGVIFQYNFIYVKGLRLLFEQVEVS